MKIRLAGIKKESIVDGPGLRFTIFAQGCPHGCKGCHNPSTHEMQGGEFYDIYDLAVEIMKNPLLDGVTFSGGEPFCQPVEFLEIAKALGKKYSIYCYTGYLFEELVSKGGTTRDLLSKIDVLIDGPYIDEKRSIEIKFKGSLNQRIIDCKKSLVEGKVILFE
ncbi:MAG: anaerobic ribonucleoside-triphosphate reductase activating protein [Eubacterium sp.]|jgi:anaerobic ribonucleoside-triphosphate reductase activating protein|nr:anaerobic ribonucleoside-triphosphate reductase activating protein [Eubacterium sp.]